MPHPPTCTGLAGATLLGIVLMASAGCEPGEAAAPSPSDDPPHSGASSHLIFGGTLAVPGEWDAVAAIAFGNANESFCSGVLVAPDVVLTAAHCVQNWKQHDQVLMVSLGGVDFRSPVERLRVVRGESHPSFHSFDFHGQQRMPRNALDIGLLYLERPSRIAPSPVATPAFAKAYLSLQLQVVTLGYGDNDSTDDARDSYLRQLDVMLVDPDCRNHQPHCSRKLELVAGRWNGGACSGDSGGPLYVRTAAGPVLIATLSRQASTPRWRGGCEGDQIYVRADVTLSWMEQMTGRRLTPPLAPPLQRSRTDGCSAAGDGDGAPAAWLLLIATALWLSTRRKLARLRR